LDHPDIIEASGLASSRRSEDRLWVVNDGGSSPVLYALGTDGHHQQSIRLRGARNLNWEDLASFSHEGKDWLLVADVGDNEANREYVSLYLVEEPDTDADSITAPVREIRVTYPDGPLDCEAVAIDGRDGQIVLLSKREIPAILYAIPLDAVATAEPLLATRLGSVTGIPQPSETDIERALADENWHWQPTAMDISGDSSLAVILTYTAAYVFRRFPGDSWIAAFAREPLRLDLADTPLAEAIAFGAGGNSIFVTTEGGNAPLLRFDQLQ
jgi:hypothetical protein